MNDVVVDEGYDNSPRALAVTLREDIRLYLAVRPRAHASAYARHAAPAARGPRFSASPAACRVGSAVAAGAQTNAPSPARLIGTGALARA